MVNQQVWYRFLLLPTDITQCIFQISIPTQAGPFPAFSPSRKYSGFCRREDLLPLRCSLGLLQVVHLTASPFHVYMCIYLDLFSTMVLIVLGTFSRVIRSQISFSAVLSRSLPLFGQDVIMRESRSQFANQKLFHKVTKKSKSMHVVYKQLAQNRKHIVGVMYRRSDPRRCTNSCRLWITQTWEVL